MNSGTVVQVRADIHLLDAGLFPEEANTGAVLSGEAPRGRLRVTTPKQYHVTVFCYVLQTVGSRRHHALKSLTPDMLCPPIPAFPTVRISYLLGESPHHVE